MASGVRFICPECGTQLKSSSLPSRRVKCPRCSHVFEVGAATSEAKPEAERRARQSGSAVSSKQAAPLEDKPEKTVRGGLRRVLVYGGGAVVVVAVLGLIGIGVLRYAPPAKMPAPHDIADEANVVQTSKPPIADEGGGRRGSGKSKPSEDRTVAKKLAFLVGVKTYDHLDLKPLEFPENDVEEVGKALEACGFETLILTNARGKKPKPAAPPRKTSVSVSSRFCAASPGKT